MEGERTDEDGQELIVSSVLGVDVGEELGRVEGVEAPVPTGPSNKERSVSAAGARGRSSGIVPDLERQRGRTCTRRQPGRHEEEGSVSKA